VDVKIRFAFVAACIGVAASPAIATGGQPPAHSAFLACGQGVQSIATGNPAAGIIQVDRNSNVRIDVSAESPNTGTEYEYSVLHVSVPFAPDPGPVGMVLVGNKYVARVTVTGSLAGYTQSRIEAQLVNVSNTLAHNVIVRIEGSCVYQLTSPRH
jgi:hypothetical protein